jgi:hypothetical protein
MNRSSVLITMVLVMTALAGCASSVQRPSPAASAANSTAVPKRIVLSPASQAGQVSMSLTDEAKKKISDNLKFDQDELLDHVKRAMTAKELLAPAPANGLPTIEIRITSVRVRTNFSAVMWGFMAGADSIGGDVIVKGTDGQPTDSFHVSVSYALGGLAGGQDSARMDWMYEKFAEETLKGLTTEEPPNKKN